MIWNVALIAVLYFWLKDSYEQVKLCKAILLTPTRVALIYFGFVVVRSVICLCVMACVDSPGVVHHFAREIFIIFDFWCVPAVTVCALVLSNKREGMNKECEVRDYAGTEALDHWITVNFYGIGIYGLIICLIVLF